MGLGNKQSGTYLTIFNGKFSQSFKEPQEGTVERLNKNNKIVHEKYFDFLSGRLVSIRTKESKDYGKSWIFEFNDGESTFLVQLPYSNTFAKAFLKMLPNIDVSKDMTLTPSSKLVDGKPKSSLFIKQGDQNIKHAFTRENLNGMPDLEEITVKGQKQLDDTKQLAFLEGMVIRDILPKLNQQKIETADSAESQSPDDKFNNFGKESAETQTEEELDF